MIEFLKDCVWSFKKKRQPKNIVDYNQGDIVSNISVKDEEEIIDAGYAVYRNEVQKSNESQTVVVETKDIQTKPNRKSVKASDDNKSD